MNHCKEISCRCKKGETPKAPQNAFTKKERLKFKKFKKENPNLPLSKWPELFLRMRGAF